MNIEKHAKTRDMLDAFVSSGFFPTITIPTRITHETSSLIDNIYMYVKLNCTSVLFTYISDDMPIFNCIGKRQSPTCITNHKYVTYRKMDGTALYKIVNNFKSLNWTLLLHNMNVNDAVTFLLGK